MVRRAALLTLLGAKFIKNTAQRERERERERDGFCDSNNNNNNREKCN